MKGITTRKIKPSGLELVDKLVGIQRVTKATKGGRSFGFTAIVVVGDENGIGGYALMMQRRTCSAFLSSKAPCHMSKTVNLVELVYSCALHLPVPE